MSKSTPIVLSALLFGACTTQVLPPDNAGSNPPPGNNNGGGNNGGGNNGGGNNGGGNNGGGNNGGTVGNPVNGGGGSSTGGGGGGINPSPAPPDSVPAPAAEWVKGSLFPVFEYIRPQFFSDLDRLDFSMENSDFQFRVNGENGFTQFQKMNEIQQTPGLLTGNNGQRTIVSDANDRLITQDAPFRGKPSDVKFLQVGNQTKIFTPLGGNIMVPGNEVEIVTLNANGQLVGQDTVVVGLRPQRLAVHPAGLIFACNQYSNYISVIDPNTNALLRAQGDDVIVATEYFCSDIVFTNKGGNQDPDEQFMFVSNRQRHSILQYDVRVDRNAINGRPSNVRTTFVKEITGVGVNPYRMTVSEQQNLVFVVSNRGGQLGRFNILDGKTAVVALNSPTADVVNIENRLFIPTTMPDRGNVTNQGGAQVPQELQAGPFFAQGLDGRQYAVHPGQITDNTNSYLFEDARNGIWQIDAATFNNPFYYTDNSSGEANFALNQKIIDGGLPWAITRNQGGDKIWVTLSGSRKVQEFNVNVGAQVSLTPSKTLNADHRALGVAFDEANNRLYVTSYMGETLLVYDLNDADAVDPVLTVNLKYAVPRFPATNFEIGELFFNDTDFSNNGDKSCVSCHFDEMDVDGIGFANGTGTPTGYKQIKPQHNLARTGPWFWNGGMGNGNYTSTAFSFQTRTNCDMIQFAFTEGPSSDPAIRIGDPNNFTVAANIQAEVAANQNLANLIAAANIDLGALDDTACRPENVQLGQPANAADIAAQNNIQKAVVAAVIQARTVDIIGQERATQLGFPNGIERTELAFYVDVWGNGEMRLAPNPVQQMWQNNQLSTAQASKLERGRNLFAQVGCAVCHNPATDFIDGKNHGGGADYMERFLQRFQGDDQIAAIGGFQEPFLQSLTGSTPDREINVHIYPIEAFTPICPVLDSCLTFEDPLSAGGDAAEEDRRLALQIAVNLGDPERQFLPSNSPGLPSVNTPSLRGVWTLGPGLLHHTHAKNVGQAILPPGHPALADGEIGYNIDRFRNIDVHGATSNLSVSDAQALIEYVNSIE